MLFDVQNTFSSAQALTTTAVSTNVLDLGVAENIGVGENLYLVMVITTAFAGAAQTMTPSLQTAIDSAFTSPVTVRTYDVFAALSPAQTKRVYRLDPYNDVGLYLRYLRLNYTVATTLTGGAITSFLSHDAYLWTPYAVGFTVQ